MATPDTSVRQPGTYAVPRNRIEAHQLAREIRLEPSRLRQSRSRYRGGDAPKTEAD